MTVGLWFAVAGVGGAGALARFLVGGAVNARARSGFPIGTLVINLSGAFGLGLLSGAGLAPNSLLITGTATIGSYTTFSTWMLESERLTEDGNPRGAAVNVLGSLVVGVAAAALGRAIGAGL